MNQIGDKIKALRKSKGITQNELAEVLSVSSQSVSKWENNLSVPDITLLPVIARYFSITMDDLFGYRLDSLNYKERFIRFMVDNGMLQFGEFTLQSGRISPYLIHSGYYKNASRISKLGEFFADAIREHSAEATSLVGISDREVPLVIATSMALYNKYGIDNDYHIFDNIADHDRDITLITDTFTSGNTLKNALEEIKSRLGRYPANVIVSVDRMEFGSDMTLSSRKELESKFKLKIHSIVSFDDIIQAIENGVIAYSDHLESMKEYRRKYVE